MLCSHNLLLASCRHWYFGVFDVKVYVQVYRGNESRKFLLNRCQGSVLRQTLFNTFSNSTEDNIGCTLTRSADGTNPWLELHHLRGPFWPEPSCENWTATLRGVTVVLKVSAALQTAVRWNLSFPHAGLGTANSFYTGGSGTAHTEGRAWGGKEEQKKRAGRWRGPAGVGPPRLRPGVSLWKTARRLSAACGKFLAGKLVNSGERRPRALRGGGVGGEDVSGPAEGGSAADGARGLPSGLGVLGPFSGKGSRFFGGKSTFFLSFRSLEVRCRPRSAAGASCLLLSRETWFWRTPKEKRGGWAARSARAGLAWST